MTLYKNRLQGSLGIYTPFMSITMNAQTTKHYDGWNTLCLQNSLKYFLWAIKVMECREEET